MELLIAEDENDIRELLRLHLCGEGYRVTEAADGAQAWELLRKNRYDLAVLDVMMPRLDGFNLLTKLRGISDMPVMFLTARGDDMDKVLGLGIGADDYLVKPFSMAEFLARVAALLRRSRKLTAESDVLQVGEIKLDTLACCAYKKGAAIELNAKEFLLLKHLMENPERVFTKKQLYAAVWNEDVYYDDNTVMVHISHLRNKIEEDPKEPQYIKTIRGIGYKFSKNQRADK